MAETVNVAEHESSDAAARALQNYEHFHHLPRGTATLDQVKNSSAGIAGWARTGTGGALQDSAAAAEAGGSEARPRGAEKAATGAPANPPNAPLAAPGEAQHADGGRDAPWPDLTQVSLAEQRHLGGAGGARAAEAGGGPDRDRGGPSAPPRASTPPVEPRQGERQPRGDRQAPPAELRYQFGSASRAP